MFHLRVISKAAITPNVAGMETAWREKEAETLPASRTQQLPRGRLRQMEHPEPTESLVRRRAAADLEASGQVHTRTCAKCGRWAWFRMEEGGWARCSKCGRYT
ncbi:MAG TPA: hypothetical protein VE915_00560 [Actinomycetota bacterium]|nr:hypothetical protein [Actinomycetota bacterium]